MTVGMPVADASAAPRGSLAFLQGKFAGATFPKGLFAQARAVFGGLPHDPSSGPLASGVHSELLTHCQTRRCRGCNCCAETQIVLRWREKHVAAQYFPRNNEQGALRWQDHSPRNAGESALTARTAIEVVMAGPAA